MNLEALGFNAYFEREFAKLAQTGWQPARVARQDRDSYVVYTAGRALRAIVRGALRHRAASMLDFPAVGDWLAIECVPHGALAPIHAILPRRSAITRRAAGTSGSAQIVAANVDTLLVCCGLDRDFNLRRIERYLTLASGSGVAPLVILTKADVCPDPLARVAQVEAVSGGAPVLALSSIDGRNVDAVRRAAPPGATAALLGSSGVGKSTLINRLLGRDELRIGAVRLGDGRGRHTTTHRQLLLLPGGGVLIDTPGLRELQLCADAADVGASFAEIELLAGACRFRDCTHVGEPGCAVRAAVESGELSAARLASYEKQQRELRYLERREDPVAASAEKARWKAVHKQARRWMRRKYGE